MGEWRAWVALAGALALGPSAAAEERSDDPNTIETEQGDAAERSFVAPIEEHSLAVVPAEEARRVVATAKYGPDEPRIDRPWSFPAQHLREGEGFFDSWMGFEPYPELSATSSLVVQRVDRRFWQAINRLDLHLWAVDFRLPFVLGQSAPVVKRNPPMEVVLKAPIRPRGWDNQILSFYLNLFLPHDDRIRADNSGAGVSAGYAVGSSVGGLQLRVGVYEGPLGLALAPSDFEVVAGEANATGSIRLGDQFALGLEAKYDQATDTPDTRLLLMPGFRFFPRGDHTVQIGLSGLHEQGDARLTRTAPTGDWRTLRYGAFLDLGYNIL